MGAKEADAKHSSVYLYNGFGERPWDNLCGKEGDGGIYRNYGFLGNLKRTGRNGDTDGMPKMLMGHQW